jgi:hypothetical protein
MPYEEIEVHNYFYSLLGDIMTSIIGFTTPLKVAQAIVARAPDGSLAPQDVEALITATTDAQAQVAITAMLLGIEQDSLEKRQLDGPRSHTKAPTGH